MIKPFQEIQFEQLQNSLAREAIPNGKRLLLIGTAEKGEFYSPFIINDAAKLEELIGEGTLLDSYEQLSIPFGPFVAYGMRIEEGELGKAVDLLRHIKFDYILFDETVKFETHFDALLDFVDVAYEKGSNFEMVHAFVSTEAFTEDEKNSLYTRIESLMEWVGPYQIEKGSFFSIVCNQLDDQYTAAYYAALFMNQNLDESPVNKPLPKAKIKREFSLAEEKEAHLNGIVYVKNSFHHGVIFGNCTCAIMTSENAYKSFPNFKIAQYAFGVIKKALHPFIGKPELMLDDKRLMDILDGIGIMLFDQGYIKDFSYDFSRTRGEIILEVILVPVFSVYSITNKTQMRSVIT